MQISMRLPESLIATLDSIAERTGHNRTDVVFHFLNWAAKEYEAEQNPLARRATDAKPSKRSGL